MKERSEKRCPIEKPQAWWVKKCLQEDDFSIVIDSDLSPKRKLYVAMSIILRLLGETDFLDNLSPDLGAGVMRGIDFFAKNPEKLTETFGSPFYAEVMSYAQENIDDGIFRKAKMEKLCNETSTCKLAINVVSGADTLIEHIKRVVAAARLVDNKDLQLSSVPVLRDIANTPVAKSVTYDQVSLCPTTKTLSFEISGNHAPDQDYGHKLADSDAMREHVGCPALASGKFPKFVRLAIEKTETTLTASQLAQPDD